MRHKDDVWMDMVVGSRFFRERGSLEKPEERQRKE